MKALSADSTRQENSDEPLRLRCQTSSGFDSGFSLVEVVITLGIIAAVFIPMMGILTMVDQSGHQSDTIFLSSSIASQIRSEVDQADRAQLDLWASRSKLDYYYDFEGLAVPGDENAAFTARLIIEKSPVSLGADVENPYLGKVTVHVCSTPGPEGAQLIDEMLSQDTNRQSRSIRTYSSVIVDLEK